jgi:hypothetical protein
VKLTTHLHLAQGLRSSGAISTPPTYLYSADRDSFTVYHAQECTKKKKTTSHLRFLSIREVTRNKFHAEDPQILDATLHLATTATRHPGFCVPLIMHIGY